MMKLAFIDLGSRLVQYFVEVSKALEPEIQVYFFCTKEKAWSISKKSSYPTFPKKPETIDPISIPESIRKQILNKKILVDNYDTAKLTSKINWLYPSLKSFFEQQKIDAIFLWNGSGLVASISVFLAHNNNMKTVFGENGYFYNTIQLDPEGVNQASSITHRIEKEYNTVDIDKSKLQQLRGVIDAYRNNNPPIYTAQKQKVKASLFSRISAEMKNLLETDFKRPRDLNKKIPSNPGTLPEKYIFIPLQVVKDSQLLLYSPLVGNNMELFISSCCSAIKAVAGKYKIVVKLHPADINNVDYSPLMKKYQDVIWLKDYPANKLIQSANLVITINSTVGVEALIHDTPVITLGDNFYNVPGVVHHVNSLEDLPQTIETALTIPPDKDKILWFLYFIYHHYFTHGSWKNYSRQSIEAVALKLCSMLKPAS